VQLRSRPTRLTFRTRLPRPTVRLRLTLLYGALFLASGIILLAVTYVLVRHATNGVIFKGQGGVVGASLGSPRGAPHAQHLQAFGPGTKGLSPQQLQAQAKQLQAQAHQQHAGVLHQLLIQSGIALAGMAVASVALGWIVAGRALRPLRTITATAREISATSLHERLALDGPNDELKELGETIDGLLARLETSFGAQRQFAANASHELRTPLARQRTVAQVALADPHATVESLRAAHERVLASGAEQERLIEALLTLSRGQAGLDARELLDLAIVGEEILVAWQSDADRRGIEMRARLAPAPLRGAPYLAERLIANLLDNALRHNHAGGHVEIATGTHSGRSVLTVANSGPLVPEAAIDQLLEPFRRLTPERTGHRDGHGLGLSIVRAIADAHDATLAVHPRPEGGLRIEVAFPAAHGRPRAASPTPAQTASAAGCRARAGRLPPG
jgi:signal transduction histidine kinase